MINYQLPAVSNVKLVIYNTLGQQVRTLVSGSQNAGSNTVQWDGRNDTGQKKSPAACISTASPPDRL
ncbi:MAG: hypothetical protein H6629_17940 [Calditrichae bacterium]|nr:hypothetical protein [Calditrichia bacterium]